VDYRSATAAVGALDPAGSAAVLATDESVRFLIKRHTGAQMVRTIDPGRAFTPRAFDGFTDRTSDGHDTPAFLAKITQWLRLISADKYLYFCSIWEAF